MNALTITNEGLIRSLDDAERAAKAMAASGFFADSRQAAQAIVKILAGQELGFGPFASMTGVHIIQGKPVLAANLMAAAIKRSGKYNYRITRLDDRGCELEFHEDGKPVGKTAFTDEDARKAGLLDKDNWRKFPRNMYFARALSNGQRWYAPDIFRGAIVYTPDELDITVDEADTVIDTKSYNLPDEVITNAHGKRYETPPQLPPQSPQTATTATVAAANGQRRSWSATTIQAILAENPGLPIPRIVNALNRSIADEGSAVEWYTRYRGWRDAGCDSDIAAENANANAKLP